MTTPNYHTIAEDARQSLVLLNKARNALQLTNKFGHRETEDMDAVVVLSKVYELLAAQVNEQILKREARKVIEDSERESPEEKEQRIKRKQEKDDAEREREIERIRKINTIYLDVGYSPKASKPHPSRGCSRCRLCRYSRRITTEDRVDNQFCRSCFDRDNNVFIDYFGVDVPKERVEELLSSQSPFLVNPA